MISFEKLEELIEVIKRYDEFDNKLSDLLYGFDSSAMSSLFLFSDYRGALIDTIGLILEGAKGDTAEDDTFGYWVYELEFGMRYKEGCLTEADGTNIKIETLKDIYEYYKKKFWVEDSKNENN